MIIGLGVVVLVALAVAFCHGGTGTDASAGAASEAGMSARTRYAAAVSYDSSYDRGAVLRKMGARKDAETIANSARSMGDTEGADGTLDGFEGRPRRYSPAELERLMNAAVAETGSDPRTAKLVQAPGQAASSTSAQSWEDFDSVFSRMRSDAAKEPQLAQTEWSILANAISRRDAVVVGQLLHDREYRSKLDQIASREFMRNFDNLVALWDPRQWARETEAQEHAQAERQRQAEVAKTIREAELVGELPESLRVTMGGYRWGATSATYVGEPENAKRTDEHLRFVKRLHDVLGTEAPYGQVLVHRIKLGQHQGEIANVMIKVGNQFLCLEPNWISIWVDETPLSENYPPTILHGKLINGKNVTRMFF